MIEVDVAVIGGGVAGVAAALEASRQGAEVALLEPGRIGGRAIHTTMMPWRALERAIDRAQTDGGEIDRDEVFASAKRDTMVLSAEWERRATLTLEDAGIELIPARASFVERHELVADRQAVHFDDAIIATGGRPVVLRGDPADGERLLRPDDLFQLERLPEELVVVGGGAAGAELVDALSRLGGTKLTWVMDEVGILPRFDRELAEPVGDVIMNRGVKLVHGKAVHRITVDSESVSIALDGGRVVATPLAVVTVGTRPALGALGLAAIGLETDERGGIDVDMAGRSAVPHIFAVGDATGRCDSIAEAEAFARRAGRAAAGVEVETGPLRVPQVARTHPAVAQIGLTPDRAAGARVIFHTLRREETIAGLLSGVGQKGEQKGLIRLVCDSESGEILGATALGEGAEDAIGAVGLALRLGAKESDLQDAFAAVPSRLDALSRVTY